METLIDRNVSNGFLNNLVTLDDMVVETIDVLTTVEKEALDEVYRGFIDIPYLQDSLKVLIQNPETMFGF